jgi:hypothetical protein
MAKSWTARQLLHLHLASLATTTSIKIIKILGTKKQNSSQLLWHQKLVKMNKNTKNLKDDYENRFIKLNQRLRLEAPAPPLL